MATYPKLTENEMNYFQYKAKQLLLLKKEDREWKEYCEEITPECAACLAEKTDAQSSKDAGIQVSSRKPFNARSRESLQFKHQKNELPEALNNIRMKLENIDLALTKMYESSQETKKEIETQHTHSSVPLNAQRLKLFEEQRKLLIRNSLIASMKKVNNSSLAKSKTISSPIKKINSGYFLPHDLQMKRAASRKAYLASLQSSQTKPKVLLHSVRKDSRRTVQSSEKKKAISKPATKSRKVITKPKVQKVNANEEATLVKTVETDEVKDDNIEYAVDSILDELLGEAVLDLNKIRLMRKNRLCFLNHKTNERKDKEKYMLLKLLTSSPKKDIPNMPENCEATHVKKLISFLDSSDKFQKIDTNLSKGPESCHKFTHLAQNSKQKFGESEKNSKVDQPAKSCKKVLPKFVCGISHIISVDPIAASEISFQRDAFWKYLKNISRTIKGNFNPWTFCNVLAESILDDCVQDVSDELANVPSTFIKDLYNQEFVQQVECHSTK